MIGGRSSTSRERRRLARAVRDYARAEHEEYHRAGLIELEPLEIRAALYERIARLLENEAEPLSDDGILGLEGLLAQQPPVRDYGPRAQKRNALIASLLTELGGQE